MKLKLIFQIIKGLLSIYAKVILKPLTIHQNLRLFKFSLKENLFKKYYIHCMHK